MKKFMALATLALASTSQAAWTDAVKKFETPTENNICKAVRTFDQGRYSDLKPAESFRSYRVNDMFLNQARIIFANALYNNGIRGNSSPVDEVLGGIYNQFVISNGKVYYIYLDPVSKYVTDVCIVVSPSNS